MHRVPQSVFTLSAPIVRSAISDLTGALGESQHGAAALRGIPGLHFARFVVAPESGDHLPATLLFSSWYDGPLPQHVEALARHAHDFFASILVSCEGFPKAGSRWHAVQVFLQRHSVPALASFNSEPHKTVDEIVSEQGLRASLRELVGSHADAQSESLADVLRAQTRADPALRWALCPSPSRRAAPSEQALAWARWAFRHAPATGRAFRDLQRRGASARGEGARLVRMPTILPEHESKIQNTYSSVAVLKPAAHHRDALVAFMRLVDTVAAVRSDLSSITSIRFAHWALLDGGRRLLFFSVFDGSLDAYICDFIDLASWGINGIWSHTLGFPSTDWCLLNGADREQEFRAFVRSIELHAPLSFGAYPGLSSDHIRDAAALRRGLHESLDRPRLDAWLSLF